MMSKSRLVSMLPLMFAILVTNGLGFTEEGNSYFGRTL